METLAMAESGIEINIRSVAERTGVTPAAAYHHFSSKDELLTEVARIGFTELLEAQQSVRHSLPDDISRITTAYINFGIRKPHVYELMFSSPPHLRPGKPAIELQRIASSSFITLVESVHLANPRLSKSESETRSLMIWSLAHGVVQLNNWNVLQIADSNISELALLTGQNALVLAKQPSIETN